MGFWDSVKISADSEMISRTTKLLGDQFEVLDELGMICFDIEYSLTDNDVYGIDESKRSDHPRTAHRVAWAERHDGLSQKTDFYMPFPFAERLFPAPEIISITPGAVKANLVASGAKKMRIVMVSADASLIGGVPTRTRRTMDHSSGRLVEYVSISSKHSREIQTPNCISVAESPAGIRRLIEAWSETETVFVVSNNALLELPADIRTRMQDFPIVYWSASQLAFMIQDSSVLQNRGYVENLRASRIVCMSQMDIDFQRQLGLRGQVKGFAPVELRPVNDYDPARNTLPTFVGRIDFHAKDCERLIDIAQVLQRRGGPRLRVFTTDGRNSPEYDQFVQMAEARGVMDQLDLHLNVEDKDVMFGGASLLLLPSKKEAFGNVILEAYSHGVPVVGASYAPGPAELIRHGQTGLLVEDFTDAEAVAAAIEALGRDDLIRMSRAAFEAHKDYSMDRYYDFLESVCAEVLEDFDGRNSLPVLPRLKMLQD